MAERSRDPIRAQAIAHLIYNAPSVLLCNEVAIGQDDVDRETDRPGGPYAKLVFLGRLAHPDNTIGGPGFSVVYINAEVATVIKQACENLLDGTILTDGTPAIRQDPGTN